MVHLNPSPCSEIDQREADVLLEMVAGAERYCYVQAIESCLFVVCELAPASGTGVMALRARIAVNLVADEASYCVAEATLHRVLRSGYGETVGLDAVAVPGAAVDLFDALVAAGVAAIEIYFQPHLRLVFA